MNPDPVKSEPEVAQAAEPKARRRAVPVWLVVLLFFLIYWGLIYFDQRSAWGNPQVYSPFRSLDELVTYEPQPEGPNIQRGKQVFDSICIVCHGPDGLGKPGQFPPLAGSEWVQGSPNRLIRIPLLGLTGPITIEGKDWNLSMPSAGAMFTDDDLASVLTYVRQAWGNKAAPVSAEEVKKIKTALGNRSQPNTADELKSLP